MQRPQYCITPTVAVVGAATRVVSLYNPFDINEKVYKNGLLMDALTSVT